MSQKKGGERGTKRRNIAGLEHEQMLLSSRQAGKSSCKTRRYGVRGDRAQHLRAALKRLIFMIPKSFLILREGRIPWGCFGRSMGNQANVPLFWVKKRAKKRGTKWGKNTQFFSVFFSLSFEFLILLIYFFSCLCCYVLHLFGWSGQLLSFPFFF